MYSLCLNCFFKKSSESRDIIISFMYQQMWNEKHAALLISLLVAVAYSPSVSLYACMKQNFLTKEDIPLHIQLLKLV